MRELKTGQRVEVKSLKYFAQTHKNPYRGIRVMHPELDYMCEKTVTIQEKHPAGFYLIKEDNGAGQWFPEFFNAVKEVEAVRPKVERTFVEDAAIAAMGAMIKQVPFSLNHPDPSIYHNIAFRAVDFAMALKLRIEQELKK